MQEGKLMGLPGRQAHWFSFLHPRFALPSVGSWRPQINNFENSLLEGVFVMLFLQIFIHISKNKISIKLSIFKNFTFSNFFHKKSL